MDETKLAAYRAIYSLHYRVEDVGTVTGNVLDVVLPHLEMLVDSDAATAHRLADELLTAIGEGVLDEETLRSCFSGYCDAIGVAFEDED